ncbi:MAG: sugar nucleotidyltransferase, partial [Gammaproteobacteria bacterium]
MKSIQADAAVKRRKGIVLAGGAGTRLHPLTLAYSKQLMPVYDKPMIYYPISTLMLAGVTEILIITTSEDQPLFERLLGDGGHWGVQLSYAVQDRPDGIAEALIIGEAFLAGAPSVLILGDNLFYGHGLQRLLREANERREGSTVFAYWVKDPERYGILRFGAAGKVAEIVEKPASPPSNYAVTGIYFFDGRAPEIASTLRPSVRGELEITDVINHYLTLGEL